MHFTAFATASPVLFRRFLSSTSLPTTRPAFPNRALKMSAPAVQKAAVGDAAPGAAQPKAGVFRSFLTPSGPFVPAPNRYHLYLSLADPFAIRCYTALSLKNLTPTISVTVVDPFMGEKGWRFVTPSTPSPPPFCESEPHGFESIRELYAAADPVYDGRCTLPVLWDKESETIVSNESSDIVVMLNEFAAELGGTAEPNLYPAERQKEIDDAALSFQEGFVNGVYRAGFAPNQEAYDEGVKVVFETLDALEAKLEKSRYLCGDKLTIADIKLFSSLIRFDPVYVVHFKCNLKTLASGEYPNVLGYTRELFQIPAIKKTVNFEHMKKHYFASHVSINPSRIVPAGPDMEFLNEPHGRGQ